MERSDVETEDATIILPDWMQLPAEVWVHILKFIPHASILFVLRHVCRLFRSLTFDPVLWTHVDFNSLNEEIRTAAHFIPFDEVQPLSNDGELELDQLTTKLIDHGQLGSSEVFFLVLQKVQHTVRHLSLSRYSDFELNRFQLQLLCQCHRLKYLDIAFCHSVNDNSLKQICSSCTQLETLILEGCREVNDACMEQVSQLSALTHINISHCSMVTDAGLQHLCNMPSRLRHFISDGVLHISDSGVMELVGRQPELQTVIVDGEQLSDLSVKLVASRLHDLRAFAQDFSENLTDASFAHLAGKTSLEQLCLKKLSNSAVTTDSIYRLFASSSPPARLRKLTIADCEAVTDVILDAISSRCVELEHVCFDWCSEVSDAGVEHLLKCRKLRWLSVVGNPKLQGSSWLDHLELSTPLLTHLDLSMCGAIRDQAVIELVHRKRDLSVFTYFHELLNYELSLVQTNSYFHQSDQLRRSMLASQQQQQSASTECAGSRGVKVDY